MNKVVALVRVSTDKQDVNNQKFAIEKKYPGYDIAWFEEPGISGAKKIRNRPELQDAIKLAKKSDCPLVVYSLSRLGRTYEGGQFLEDNKGKIELDVFKFLQLIYNCLQVIVHYQRFLSRVFLLCFSVFFYYLFCIF